MQHCSVKHVLGMTSSAVMGVLIGTGIAHPGLLLWAIIPKFVESIIYDRHKESKREMLTQSIERVPFKI